MSSTSIRGPLDKASKAIATAAVAVWFAIQASKGSSMPTEPNDWITQAGAAVGYAVSAVVLFRFAFEKFLWRWRVFRGWLVRFPDISGTWYAQSESRTFRTEFRSVVTIDHRFDRLIYKEFRAIESNGAVRIVSMSQVRTWSLERVEQGDSVHLFVIYNNEPGQDRDKAKYGATHCGCVALDLLNEKEPRTAWLLRGIYWTTKPWVPLEGVRESCKSPTDCRNILAMLSARQVGGTQGKIVMRWQKAALASTADEDALMYLEDCPDLKRAGGRVAVDDR
jgi:hypothetical protein